MPHHETGSQDNSEREAEFKEAFRIARLLGMQSLLKFALEKDASALREALARKESYRDIYVTGAPTDTPFEDVDTALVTPNGHALIEDIPTSYFRIYLRADRPIDSIPTIGWIERHRASASDDNEWLIITQDNIVYPYRPGGVLSPEDLTSPPKETPFEDVQRFFRTMDGYKPAPQAVNVKIIKGFDT